MADSSKTFKVGIDFESVLRAISKQIYETLLAFIRENVQNAVDAVRIQALRDNVHPRNERYRIDVHIEGNRIFVRDNGVGMSEHDLENFFWTIGASGKRTAEAQAAGCVGMFGIGGFANFGVCDTLEVISQTESAPLGTSTRLSESDIQAARGAIPSVTVTISNAAFPRGTLIIGHMRSPPNVEELRRYLREFVKFVPTMIYFNAELVSGAPFVDLEQQDNLTEVDTSPQEWREGDLFIRGRLYEDRGHGLSAAIESLTYDGDTVDLTGYLRFESGAIDVFKRGFKLCATQVPCTIGASGRIDCDRFIPTAGRDSLDAPSASLLSRIVLALEKVAVQAVLDSSDRIAQHTRIFRYINRHGLTHRLGKVRVRLADGSESALEDIQRRASEGRVAVFFGTSQKQALNQIMHARGHLVVLLSADAHRQSAERRYLEAHCAAKAFDGVVDCSEYYENLSRFELVFLSELELTISKSYEIKNFQLTAGKLTEDLPVFVREQGTNAMIDVLVDTRHQEIAKLEVLGYTQVLYSLIASFCREYLGQTLKKWSPRFFGNGALNLEMLAKRRSELWILLKDDIGVVHKGGQRHVVTRSDVQIVRVGPGQSQQQQVPGKSDPRILQIVDQDGGTGLHGFYIRLPNGAFKAYGDLLSGCDSRGVVWAGNKILYVISDAVSTAFQYEIRLDEVVAPTIGDVTRAEGALQLDRPLQEMFGGIYFPVPPPLQSFLVPQGSDEIRLELHCDWLDVRTAKHWTPREGTVD